MYAGRQGEAVTIVCIQVRANDRRLGLEKRGCGSYLNGLIDIPDLHGDVRRSSRPGIDHNPLLLGLLKTWCFDRHRISSRFQSRTRIRPGFIGLNLIRQAGRIFKYGDLRVWDGGSLRIGD